MGYIARAAVVLSSGSIQYQTNQWYPIKNTSGIEYRWRLKPDNTFEVFAGVFSDKFEALACAKQMYITILYNFYHKQVLIDDPGPYVYFSDFDSDVTKQVSERSHVFYGPHNIGAFTGPAVYEVENSIDDFDSYRFLKGYISGTKTDAEIKIDDIEQHVFSYTEESHRLLQYVHLAEKTHDYGMKMTIYCSILEHLAEDGKKSDAMQTEIDSFIAQVNNSTLSKEEKEQLGNYLKLGKELSTGQKCRSLLTKYAKFSYDGHTPKRIFSEAYSIRSAFSHGDKPDVREASFYMKFVVLDVIKAYMREKEGLDA